jgi:hypothetical protein
MNAKASETLAAARIDFALLITEPPILEHIDTLNIEKNGIIGTYSDKTSQNVRSKMTKFAQNDPPPMALA